MPGHAREISEKYSEKRRTFSENQGFPIWSMPGACHAQAMHKSLDGVRHFACDFAQRFHSLEWGEI